MMLFYDPSLDSAKRYREAMAETERAFEGQALHIMVKSTVTDLVKWFKVETFPAVVMADIRNPQKMKQSIFSEPPEPQQMCPGAPDGFCGKSLSFWEQQYHDKVAAAGKKTEL